MPSPASSNTPTLGERVALTTIQALQEERTPSSVARVIQAVGKTLDGELSILNDPSQRPLDCKPGCSHCCYRVVLCSVPEVVRVAEWVRANFSEEEMQLLQERLYAYEREVAPSFGADLNKLRVACPLLVDDRCSAYEARPFFCRGMNSFDAARCSEFRQHPERGPQIPMTKLRLQAAEAATQGVDYAQRKCGLTPRPHDFGRALRIALESPDAMEAWLEGGQSFKAAENRGGSRQERPREANPAQKVYGRWEEPLGHFDDQGLNLANYLMREGDPHGALASIKGNHVGSRMARLRLPPGYSSEADVAEWRAYLIRAFREFATSTFDAREVFDGLSAFNTHEISYQQVNNRELLSEIWEFFSRRITSQVLPDLCAPIEGPRRSGPIRIGFAGCDLRESSVSPWTLGWLKNRAADFEIFSINLGELEDELTLQYKAYSHHYFHIPRHMPVPRDARFIKGLDLDVLIYLDLGARSRSNQLATMRLARIQCSCWGGPETSGFPTIDYYLSSNMMEPDNGQDHYSEKLVKLPRSGVCLLREATAVAGAASTLERRDFGLDDGPLILTLQPPCKYDPEWDDLYLSINERSGQPIVVVDRPNQDRKIVRTRWAQKGIQVRFVPHLSKPDYRALLEMADVVLDTPGWNGGITTIDALDVGTPVVTLPTDLRRGRQTSCLLELAGAPGLVAKGRAEFVDLVTNDDRRREASKDMDSRALYDDVDAVRAFEEFVRSIVQL